MDFGDRLRDARKRKGLTQRQLADMIGAKHNSVSNWENGLNMPDPDLIQNLCWALDVDANYFFDDLNTAKPAPSPTHMTSREVAFIYDGLDDHGKIIIDAVIRLEVKRMEEKHEA